MGFSLDELRHMPMSDFIAYMDCAGSANSDESEGNRQATQADIDAFYL